jgi:hypothetical protein
MSLFNLFSSFFQQNDNFSSSLKQSTLLDKINALSTYSNLTVILNPTLYTPKKNIQLPLVILDNHRGLYIFELRNWTKDELTNITIQAQPATEQKQTNLAFSLIHERIKSKAKELFEKEQIPIYNFLILDKLNSQEYDSLDLEVQQYLPKECLLFEDTTTASIYKKLHACSKYYDTAFSYADNLLAQLYPNYAFKENQKNHFMTNQQQTFIQTPLPQVATLNAQAKSGKTIAILLKIINILLEKKEVDILLLCVGEYSKQQTLKLFKELCKQNAIEHKALQIQSVAEFLDTRADQYKISPPTTDKKTLEINEKLLKKRKKAADILICDDAQLLEENFLDYLELIQKKASILFVNHPREKAYIFKFTHSFFKIEGDIVFQQAHPLIKTIHHLKTILQQNNTKKQVYIYSNKLTKHKLQEDLSQYLTKEEQRHLSYRDYNIIADKSIEHIILLDICQFKTQKVEYALTRATKSIALFYEQECGSIKILKEDYEN